MPEEWKRVPIRFGTELTLADGTRLPEGLHEPGKVPKPDEETVAHGLETLKAQFYRALGSESVGGNAGQNRSAVNAEVDPATGRITKVTNYPVPGRATVTFVVQDPLDYKAAHITRVVPPPKERPQLSDSQMASIAHMAARLNEKFAQYWEESAKRPQRR